MNEKSRFNPGELQRSGQFAMSMEEPDQGLFHILTIQSFKMSKDVGHLITTVMQVKRVILAIHFVQNSFKFGNVIGVIKIGQVIFGQRFTKIAFHGFAQFTTILGVTESNGHVFLLFDDADQVAFAGDHGAVENTMTTVEIRNPHIFPANFSLRKNRANTVRFDSDNLGLHGAPPPTALLPH